VNGAKRGVRRFLVVTGMVVAAVAAGRVALGRLAGDPGTPRQRGSFDRWPAVPTAPGRSTPTDTDDPAAG
jgi:hypothetical protein